MRKKRASSFTGTIRPQTTKSPDTHMSLDIHDPSKFNAEELIPGDTYEFVFKGKEHHGIFDRREKATGKGNFQFSDVLFTFSNGFGWFLVKNKDKIFVKIEKEEANKMDDNKMDDNKMDDNKMDNIELKGMKTTNSRTKSEINSGFSPNPPYFHLGGRKSRSKRRSKRKRRTRSSRLSFF